MEQTDTHDSLPDAFDRALGLLDGLPDVLQTPQSTVQNVTPLTGRAETFIVQTIRQVGRGDAIFLQVLSAERSLRLVIPPSVAKVIQRQNAALTKRSLSRAAKLKAQARKQAGLKPAFTKRRASK